MNWIELVSNDQLDSLIEASSAQPQIIFKHSTRCSISTVAKNRLERAGLPGHLPFYFLDLLSYRPLSNTIAEQFGIEHQSPQILVIKNGKCVYTESHSGIVMDEILENARLN
jgi:bacillithiol system protein YtxJ